MRWSAKAYFKDASSNNSKILLRAETNIPLEFVRRFKRNVAPLTPRKTAALRRSLVTQIMGNRAEFGWRSSYAAAQHAGGHTVNAKRVVNIDGKFVTLMPGYYQYRRYTTPGTGPRFGSIAYQKTKAEMPQAFREMGLTK